MSAEFVSRGGGGKYRRTVHDNSRLATIYISPIQDLGSVPADGDGAIDRADPATHRPMLDLGLSRQLRRAVGAGALCPQGRIVQAVL